MRANMKVLILVLGFLGVLLVGCEQRLYDKKNNKNRVEKVIIKNLILTGMPGCGKTTLIKGIISQISIPAYGFYTEEIREPGAAERTGFKIKTLDGKEGAIASVSGKGDFIVGRYQVKIDDLENIGLDAVKTGIHNSNSLIVIDEIGAMQLFSAKFKEVVLEALNCKNYVLATMKVMDDEFIDAIKARKDTKIFYLTRDNQKETFDEIMNLIISKTN